MKNAFYICNYKNEYFRLDDNIIWTNVAVINNFELWTRPEHMMDFLQMEIWPELKDENLAFWTANRLTKFARDPYRFYNISINQLDISQARKKGPVVDVLEYCQAKRKAALVFENRPSYWQKYPLKKII